MTSTVASLITATQTAYRFVDEDTLLDDFFRDVALILEGRL